MTGHDKAEGIAVLSWLLMPSSYCVWRKAWQLCKQTAFINMSCELLPVQVEGRSHCSQKLQECTEGVSMRAEAHSGETDQPGRKGPLCTHDKSCCHTSASTGGQWKHTCIPRYEQRTRYTGSYPATHLPASIVGIAHSKVVDAHPQRRLPDGEGDVK